MNDLTFEEILDKYGDMVYRIIYTHTLDKCSAEDIFQDVFLKLVNNYSHIKNEEHLKYWLIRTSENQCRTFNSRLRFSFFTNSQEELEKTSSDEDVTSVEMNIIIGQLPEKYRTVVLLCICEGYTAEQAAKMLHRSVGTVKSQVYRAKRILRRILEEE